MDIRSEYITDYISLYWRRSMYSFVCSILLTVITVCSIPARPAEAGDPKEVAMSKATIACIISPEKFRDEELFIPKAALEKAGYQIVIASTRIGTASGMLGGFAIATRQISDLKSADLAALIVVGGSGSPHHLWGNSDLHLLANDMASAGKPVAAICVSPAVFARAGILNGKKATVFKDRSSIAELEKSGAIYEPKACVVDGNIITADGPEAAAEFVEEILRLLDATSR